MISQSYPLYARITDGPDTWTALVVAWTVTGDDTDQLVPVLVDYATPLNGEDTTYVLDDSHRYTLTVDLPTPPPAPGADPTLPVVP